MTTANNAVFFFNASYHVLTDMVALLCKMSMQSLTAIAALLSFIMSHPNQQLTLVAMYLLVADITIDSVSVA